MRTMITGICVFIHLKHLSWWSMKNNKNNEKLRKIVKILELAKNYRNSARFNESRLKMCLAAKLKIYLQRILSSARSSHNLAKMTTLSRVIAGFVKTVIRTTPVNERCEKKRKKKWRCVQCKT